MGKSPGRWIKNVLFGKKASKSNFAKGKEKSADEKEVQVRLRAPETGKDASSLEVSNAPVDPVHVDEQNFNSEYREASQLEQDEEIPVSGNENADVKQTMELDSLTDAEIIAQEKAATKAQAAFRGYLARRAFKALKGIIRLQALIRGHLVRRQAVSTLYCMIGIVKLQALVRGSMIRSSDAGLEVQRVCIVKSLDGKMRLHEDGVSASMTALSGNVFVRKLLAPSPAVMPLRVQYELTDPNSVPNWLERWSVSCPWKPVSPPKKVVNSRVQKKQGNSQAAEVEMSRPKRSVRKVYSPSFDNISAQLTSESEKPRRNMKKVSIHPADSTNETPQNELEKVKRSLRKVHSPVTESSKPETTEKPTSLGKAVSPTVQEVSSQMEVNPVEEIQEETSMIVKEEIVPVSEATEVETMMEKFTVNNEPENFSNGDNVEIESESLECVQKDENTSVSNGGLKSKEDSMSENQKSSRRVSFPAKQEHVEDGLQNTPKLPSYMQATQSAKAKLRAQGSPRTPQDGSEKNDLTRRHSLPSSANGKASSVSPKTQKPLQGSGKGGNRSDKSLLSSRDGNGKSAQAQWRR